MPMKIVILEDNAERQAAMLHCLEDRFKQYECRFFARARDMIGYLQENLPETLAISLDHDLALHTTESGITIDDGTGREVAEFLVSQPAACPVVIHSTNDHGATAMEMMLNDAHWTTHRVVPFGDLEWVPTVWFRTIRNAIVGAVAHRQLVKG